jgi:hypothetical protein
LEILSNNDVNSNVIDTIKENILCFVDILMLSNFPIGDMEMEEIQEKAEQIVEKLYKDWIARGKPIKI